MLLVVNNNNPHMVSFCVFSLLVQPVFGICSHDKSSFNKFTDRSVCNPGQTGYVSGGRSASSAVDFFAENEEKTWGELDCFCQCSITENPYISRVFDARSSKQHWGFRIRAAPVYIAAPRRAKLFFENKKVLSRSRERTSKRNDAKF